MHRKKLEKKFKLIFLFSIFIFISSVGFKFYLCSVVTIKNSEFEQAFLRKKELEEDIDKLRSQSAYLSSIGSIEKRAKELGFVEMSERLASLDLSASDQVAVLQ